MSDYVDTYSVHAMYVDAVRAAVEIAHWTAAPAGIIRSADRHGHVEYVAAAWEALAVWPDENAVLRSAAGRGSNSIQTRICDLHRPELRELMWAHRVGDAATIAAVLDAQTVGMAPRSAVSALTSLSERARAAYAIDQQHRQWLYDRETERLIARFRQDVMAVCGAVLAVMPSAVAVTVEATQ